MMVHPREVARTWPLLVAFCVLGCGANHEVSSTDPSGSEAAAVSDDPTGPAAATRASGGSTAEAPIQARSEGERTPSSQSAGAPSAGAHPAAGSVASPGAATTTHTQVSGEAIEVEQHLTDVRPEFVDFLWNNLDAEHFEQWFSGGHESFVWESPPKAPGDLGAEPGASFRATELIGGNLHELVVTYLDRAQAGDDVTLDYAMVADVMVDGQGPVRWTVQYTSDGDWDLLLSQRLEAPPGESPDAWRSHLEQRMANLPGFLKSWFQKEYVQGELMSRGESEITIIGDAISGDFDIVVTQHIAKVNHDMIDWWWDNIKDSMRYHRWHPIAHQQFTWLTPPKNTMDLEYDVGAVQQIVEIIGDASTLDIGWLSPANLPFELTYEHFVYGSTMLSGTPFGGFLLHEYDNDVDRGGINMKSTFRLPALAGMPFAEALAAHCIQEMQFLQYFLPGVFEAEYRP